MFIKPITITPGEMPVIPAGRANRFFKVNQMLPSRPKMAVTMFSKMNRMVNRPVSAFCPHSGQNCPSNSFPQFKHFILSSVFYLLTSAFYFLLNASNTFCE